MFMFKKNKQKDLSPQLYCDEKLNSITNKRCSYCKKIKKKLKLHDISTKLTVFQENMNFKLETLVESLNEMVTALNLQQEVLQNNFEQLKDRIEKIEDLAYNLNLNSKRGAPDDLIYKQDLNFEF